jgi:hypothetical protein
LARGKSVEERQVKIDLRSREGDVKAGCGAERGRSFEKKARGGKESGGEGGGEEACPMAVRPSIR